MPTGSNPDPCKITTGKAVTGAFGGTIVNESAGTSGTGSLTCQFSVRNANPGISITLQLSLIKPQSAAVFSQVKKQPGHEPVSGVGDDAFYVPQTRTLQLRVGQTVAVMSAGPAGSLTSAQASTVRADQIALGRQIAAQQ